MSALRKQIAVEHAAAQRCGHQVASVVAASDAPVLQCIRLIHKAFAYVEYASSCTPTHEMSCIIVMWSGDTVNRKCKM
jgi:hypothetical protein